LSGSDGSVLNPGRGAAPGGVPEAKALGGEGSPLDH